MKATVALLLLAASASAQTVGGSELEALRSRLLGAAAKHLDLLLEKDGTVVPLKAKSSDAMTASSFQIIYELTGNPRYKAAALQLADRIVTAMKGTRFGVLYIKEKEDTDGKGFPGGGPPAMGWYTAAAAHILHRHGGRDADLRYIGGVLDQFPWNDQGWWSADINIQTGKSKQALSKPSPVNKNVAMAAAAARVAACLRGTEPALSERLRRKAETCLLGQVLPAQEPDGFWHYGLTGNDSRNKDILGYFMVTMDGLIQMREYTDLHRTAGFVPAMNKAGGFAVRCIASITDPNQGKPCPDRATPATPLHYRAGDDLKRGFRLGLTLLATREYGAAIAVLNETLPHFVYGNRGSDGSHAVHACTLMLKLLSGSRPAAGR